MRSRLRVTLLLSLCLVALPSSHLWAYLSGPFDASYLMEKADVVCRVKVLSLDVSGTMTDTNAHPPIENTRMLARAQVVTAIKGNPGTQIDVAFPNPWRLDRQFNMIDYTKLASGDIVIVFLRKSDSSAYEFVDVHNGALRVPSKTPVYDLGIQPRDRMLAELLALLKSKERGKAGERLDVVEQLGSFSDIRAGSALRQLSASEDVTLRGVSLASRIRIGDWPSAGDLTTFLTMDPPKGVSMAPSTHRSLLDLRKGILQALQVKLESVGTNPQRVQAQKAGYARFLKKSLDSVAAKNASDSRGEIAHTMRALADQQNAPDLIPLLDDPDWQVRYFAATGLAAINGKNDYYVATFLFRQDEATYIDYWKKWWNGKQGR